MIDTQLLVKIGHTFLDIIDHAHTIMQVHYQTHGCSE